jgi:ATP sulfurylase
VTGARSGPVALPAPHGGRLTQRLVAADRVEALAAQAARLPAVPLDGRGLADLECLAVGAFSPLTGFLDAADHTSVVERGRLAGGHVWTLPVPAEALASAPERLALTDRDGTVLAVVDVEEVHDPDPVAEAKFVFETDDPAHPGVAATLFIVGRDHAGVGSWYGTYAAQEAFDAYDPGELGIQPLRFEHAFFCRRCEGMATSRTCPHPAATRVHLSGTAVRDLLARGQLPPPQFSRPEVARLLADGYRAQRG